ncbi:MAG: LamG-like jellyroll fold domain-containing protein, partial [Nanoarchaeota archaeon]
IYSQEPLVLYYELPAEYFMRDLIALYHFEEDAYFGQGVKVRDSSGNAYHGAVNGNCNTTADGYFGRGLSMDGDDWVLLPDEATVKEMSEMTISLWYKIEDNDFSGLLSHNEPMPNDLSLGVDGSNLYFSTNDVSLSAPASPYEWHHVALAAGDGTYRLYLDGELVDSEAGPVPNGAR